MFLPKKPDAAENFSALLRPEGQTQNAQRGRKGTPTGDPEGIPRSAAADQPQILAVEPQISHSPNSRLPTFSP